MGSIGATIFAFFGAAFAALTLHWALRWSGMALGWPFAVAAILAGFAWRAARGTSRFAMSPVADKAWLWSTVGEGVGIFVGINIVGNLGRADLQLPVIAFVVGLHFLPMGWLFPFRPFIVLGLALEAIALLGFLLPAPSGTLVAGFGSAFGLWSAAVLAIHRQAHQNKGKRTS